MPTPAEMMIGLLDEDDRATLQRLAVARTITVDVARVVLPPQKDNLEDLPLLSKAAWDDSGNTFLLDENVREALLGRADKNQQAALHLALADYYLETGDELTAWYHRLHDPASKAAALQGLEQKFDERIQKFQLGQAHEILRLLEEAGGADDVLARLRPRLTRRASSLRERDLTARYLTRDFEADAWRSLRDDPSRWILQLHAPGGMGKTMFVSNLVGRVLPNEEIPTAKVDFDFVAHLVQSTSEPWRLLLLLARQLNEQLEGTPFFSLLSEWGRYESVVYSPRRREDLPPIGVDTEQLRAGNDVPRYFARILAEVCQSRHVVIVFDTVENLLHADGATVMNLLEALSEVHASVPGLRLVLAGRFDFAELRSTGDGSVVERLPGFRAAYLGRTITGGISAGVEVVSGDRCFTIAVPPFTKKDAEKYLAMRGVERADYVSAIVNLAGGNPLKLSLLADEVTTEDPPTVEELVRIRSVELHHLVKRVIDRIADGQVQWLVRWGAIPRVLEKEYARKVLWELLCEQLEGEQPWDNVELDDLSKLGRGSTRYAVDPQARDFETAWSKLASYASARSWISAAPNLPDSFVFHPETRDPIRGLLRKYNQAIYGEAHRRGLEHFRALASALTGHARYEAMRAAVFHLFEPRTARPDPTHEFYEFLESAGNDRELRAGLATEVLDVEIRSSRPDREDLAPPPAAALSRAHAELALRAAFAPGFEPTRAVQFERHLALSDLTEGMRQALRARVALGSGRSDEALLLFASALERESELDADTSWWVKLTRARLERDLPALRSLRAAASSGAPSSEVTGALAAELFRREKLDESADLYRELGDFAGEARALSRQGEFDAALQVLRGHEGVRSRIVRAEVHLARLEPERVFADSGLSSIIAIDEHNLPSGSLLFARASAMANQSDADLSVLESNYVRDDDLGEVDAVTAARIYLDRGRPEQALKAIDSLPANPPPELKAHALLLRAEAWLRCGDPRRANVQLSLVDEAELPISLAVELQLVKAQVSGFSTTLPRLVELLGPLPTSNWRLVLLEGLQRIESPPPVTTSADSNALDQLTTPEPGASTRLLLARVEILRVLGRVVEARSLLDRIATSSSRANIERIVLQASERLSRQARMSDQKSIVPRELRARRLHEATRRGRPLESFLASEIDTEEATYAAPMELAYERKDARGSVSAYAEVVAAPTLAVSDDRRSQLPAPWGLVPERGEVFPAQALEALFEDWQGSCEALGEQLEHFVPGQDPTAREFVIDVLGPEQAWIPWQMATIHGAPVRGVRRAFLDRPHPRSNAFARLSGSVSLLVEPAEHAQVTAKAVRGAWQDVVRDVVTSRLTGWQDWSSVIGQGAAIVHVVGSFNQRRGGTVFVNLTKDRSESTGSAHVARALAGASRPILLVLDSPWPGSITEAARQLFLREQFAFEVFREFSGANVLCLGLIENYSALSPFCFELTRSATQGPLGEIVASLMGPRDPESLSERLGCAATLYSHDPDLRFEP